MITAYELAGLMREHSANNSEFKMKESITFDEAYERCKKFISKNSKKSSALKEGTSAKQESERLIDLFVNKSPDVDGYSSDEKGLDLLRKELKDEIVNYKAITELIEDRGVDEIRINSHGVIFYEKKGKAKRSEKKFKNREELEKVLAKLIGDERRLSKATPFINSRTPEGFRINATDKSISPIGDYTAVIRKFKNADEKLQIEDIIAGRSLSDNMSVLLKILPRARFSFATVGGTGSGKTVTNEIITRGINPGDRVVYIENPCELTPAKYDEETGEIINDFIQMQADDGDGRNAKSTHPTPNNLVENALRQTPVWIVLGETRSDEQFAVLLKAAQTGHKVITTYHAENPEDAVRRYLTAYMSTASNVPAELALKNICAAFRFIVNVERLEDGSRRVMYISEVVGSIGLDPIINDIYKFEIEKVEDDGSIRGKHKRVGKLSDKAVEQLRKSSVPDSHFRMFLEDPAIGEEETYIGIR